VGYGSSIAEYILKCRLDHALAEIACSRKAIDVVLEYGFDTYAGFYKAFVKMYGCSPKKYLSIYQEHKPEKKPEVVNMYTEKELRTILETGILKKICLLVMFIFRTVQKSQETSGQ